MAKKLTAAQRAAERRAMLEVRFADLYCGNGHNGTQAYMAIFPRAQQGSAAAKASLWLRKDNVQAEIRRLTNIAWKNETMSAEETLGRMSRIAHQNIADYYWQVGELKLSDGTEIAAEFVGRRKPLAELTRAQTECIKGFKFSATGLVVQEHYSKDTQLLNMAKHHKLMTDRVDVNLTMPLDKMIESSYGENKEQA